MTSHQHDSQHPPQLLHRMRYTFNNNFTGGMLQNTGVMAAFLLLLLPFQSLLSETGFGHCTHLTDSAESPNVATPWGRGGGAE